MQRVLKPLVVRLCNWVGEAVLALPGLLALQNEGYELHLIGKRWAISLFAAHGWKVHVRPSGRVEAIQQLRALRRALNDVDPSFVSRVNTLLLTNSFSSALEARLAGLRPTGYAKEGRGWLLAKAIPFVTGLHASENYWRVSSVLLARHAGVPDQWGLRVDDAQVKLARRALGQIDPTKPYVVLCPFSGSADTTGKKLWPSFSMLAGLLQRRGLDVVLCPGPGEEADAARDFPGCHLLPGLDLGLYAALMRDAVFVVSNDTGPGHIAAAVGACLLSIFGPGSTQAWTPVGQDVHVLQPAGRWPTLTEVLAVMDEMVTSP